MSAVDYEADAGLGLENVTQDDIQIPRVGILQSLSQQLKKSSTLYIPTAKAGDVADNILGHCWDGGPGITVVPISYRKTYTEWDEDRKFVADHGFEKGGELALGAERDGWKLILGSGNALVLSSEFLVTILDDDCGPAIISMKSSQLKKAKQWISLMRAQKMVGKNGKPFNPPMFAYAYQLSTTLEHNSQNEWYGWKIEMAKQTVELENGEFIYNYAKELNTQYNVDLFNNENENENEEEEEIPF